MESYKPVDCGFVDLIEIAATQKKSGIIQYLEGEKLSSVEDQITTWESIEKQEFLFTKGGLKIRLDRIVSLFGMAGPAFRED